MFGTWRKIVFVPSCHSCYDVSRWSICHQFAETFQQKWLLSKSCIQHGEKWLTTQKQRSMKLGFTKNKEERPKLSKFLKNWRLKAVAFEISEVLGKVLITQLWGMTELKVKYQERKTFVSYKNKLETPVMTFWNGKFFLNLCCRS